MDKQPNRKNKIQVISYQNFKDVDHKYVKFYSSFTEDRVRLNIIDYPAFKEYLIEHYDDEKLQWIFNYCPYTFKLATREGDVKEFMRDNIKKHSTLKLVQRGGKRMVFVNKAKGGIYSVKEMYVLRDLDDSLIDYDEFVEYAFDDFVAYRTRLLCESVERNFRSIKERDDTSPRSLVEKIADMYRYYEDKVYIDEELKESKGIVIMFTHFAILEIFEDATVGVSFKATTLPDVAAKQILTLQEIDEIEKITLYENFYVDENGHVLWNPKVNVEISEN